MTQDTKIIDLQKENEGLRSLLDLGSELTKVLRSESFKKIVQSYNIPEGCFKKTLADITLAFAKLPKEKSGKKIEYEFSTIIQTFIASAVSRLSLNPSVQDAYIIPYYNNKTGKTELQFMPSYLGLQNKAFERGYIIDCDYILYNEIDSIQINKITNEIKTSNLKSRLLMGIPTIPDLNFRDTLVNELLEQYDWKKNDIVGFYAFAVNTHNSKIERIETMSIAGTMERCMETKKEGWDDSIKSYKTVKRDYKNQILKDHLNTPNGVRRTDVIEILKIRVIRYICKRIPSLRDLANTIDEAEGYIASDKMNFKNVNPNITIEDEIIGNPIHNAASVTTSGIDELEL